MYLLESVAKEILRANGINVPRGIVASQPEEAEKAAMELGGETVVKVQVPSGGRGKAGGVKVAKDHMEAGAIAREFLEKPLFGFKARTVLVEEKVPTTAEFYVGLINDRDTEGPVAIASAMGGMEIEEVAQKFPNRVGKLPFNFTKGLKPYQIRVVGKRGGIGADFWGAFVFLFSNLWNVFKKYDANLAEINPLIVTPDGRLVAADARIIVEDDALFRQKELKTNEYEYLSERERFCREKGYGYVEFNFKGEIACVATGAGLAMTSMDLINDVAPESLAFFLDVGGRFVASTGDALYLASMFPNLKAILLNRYGGFGRGDIIAESMIDGLLLYKPKVPVFLHVSGSGEKGAIEYFKKMEPKVKKAGIIFEWTSHLVTGKESECARKGGIDIIEYPVKRVLEWAGYKYYRKSPQWLNGRRDWEATTRKYIREACSQRPEVEYQELGKVE